MNRKKDENLKTDEIQLIREALTLTYDRLDEDADEERRDVPLSRRLRTDALEFRTVHNWLDRQVSPLSIGALFRRDLIVKALDVAYEDARDDAKHEYENPARRGTALERAAAIETLLGRL